MAKVHHGLLGSTTTAFLAAILLLFLPYHALGLDVNDIFTVQNGNTDGGCGARMAVLDQWHTESIYSLAVAVNAVDRWSQEPAVRRSMRVIFNIPNKPSDTRARSDAQRVADTLQYLVNFLNRNPVEGGDPGRPMYDRSQYWLFCDSTFLALYPWTAPALDYEANEIRDRDGNNVPIEAIPGYSEKIGEDPDNEAWWSGDLTSLNGYFFDVLGGEFCAHRERNEQGVLLDPPLGVTASIEPLRRGPDGTAVPGDPSQIAGVIVCPYAFEDPKRPDSYREANQLLAQGTNLARAVPKSATLVHELLHVFMGDSFAAGLAEQYDIGKCLNQGRARSLINPENYVFFIAHMYHLFGTVEPGEENEPWSIATNWDFSLQNTVFGATRPR